MSQGRIIVADFGKSVSKVSLWSRDGRLLDRQSRANPACEADGIRRLDVEGIAAWLIDALSRYREDPVEAIIPIGHGAGLAALRGSGLAFAPFDYEQAIPAPIADEYRRERDAFTETGSPALPVGLNLGGQLFWQDRLYPDVMDQVHLLLWPQYWSWFLSGVARSEVTSLGCHTDLWIPSRGTFSSLAVRRGWADRFALLAKAGAVVGTLRSELSARTGLPPTLRVLVGLHDSNAALLAARAFAEVRDRDATVLSTGTWFVAMRSAKDLDLARIPEGRDCLVNVDVDRRPVPSARFMGGREVELLGERIDQPGLAGAAEALASGAMILPSQVPGCGPFPAGAGGWLRQPAAPAARRAAVALYAALMTDAALELIGARDLLFIEGRFAASEIFVRALATLRPDMRVFTGDADASFGALRLVVPDARPDRPLTLVEPLALDLPAYRREWRSTIEGEQG